MRIAICDNDADFADNLRALMEKELSALYTKPVILVYNGGHTFISDKPECDVAFLDIDMPAMSGFDIAELAPFDFIRTHKSYLVNCKYIYAIEKGQIIPKGQKEQSAAEAGDEQTTAVKADLIE